MAVPFAVLPWYCNHSVAAFIVRLRQAIGVQKVNQVLGKRVAGVAITHEHLWKLFCMVVKWAVYHNTHVGDVGLNGHWSDIGRVVLSPPNPPMQRFNSSVGGKVKNLYATVSTRHTRYDSCRR
jgi:hypothetical protein